MKTLLNFILCVLSFHICFAQDKNEEAKKHLAMAFKFHEAIHATQIAIPGEYIMTDGIITGQYYASSSYSTFYKPGNVFAANVYPHPEYTKVLLTDGNCSPLHIEFYPYTVTLNDDEQIVRLEEKNYSIFGKNKIRTFYLVEHGPDKHVKEVKEGRIVLDNKTKKPLFDYIIQETSLLWKTENDVTINTANYSDKQKEKDKQQLIVTHTYHTVIHKNKVESSGDSDEITEYITTGNETIVKTRS